MSADKRRVSTDATATIGTIIDESMGRDAIHVAVYACKAGGTLYAGQHIGISNGVAAQNATHVGIVDPFLDVPVYRDQYFWMLLYPRTITSLRHVWSHPSFDDVRITTPDKVASEASLRDFCANADCPDYDDLIAAAIGENTMKDEDDQGYEGYYRTYNDGEYLHFGGRNAHGEIPPEFWDHVEIVTGKKITNRAKYFSCSC